MPNYVINKVTCANMDELKKLLLNKDENVDFNIIIPRPEDLDITSGSHSCDIQSRYFHTEEAERKLENDLIEKIVDASEVEVPEILIERQLDMFIKDLEARLSYQGLKLDEYLGYLETDVQKLREERKEQAKQSCKTRLVLEELIKKENLYVTDEELNAKLQEMADLYKKDLEEYKKTLDNNTVAYFENDILMKKLLDFLKANNTIA